MDFSLLLFFKFYMFYMFSDGVMPHVAWLTAVKVRQKAGQGKTKSGSG